MNRSQRLLVTTDLTVSRFDHPSHEEHCDPELETATDWSISFVQKGAFDVLFDDRRRTLTRGGALITSPGLTFRCRHAERFPTDVCTSVNFAAAAVTDAEPSWLRLAGAHESITPRLAYVDQRLASAMHASDVFEMERWGLAALSALIDDAERSESRGQYAVRGRTLDAIVTTCRTIEADPTTQVSVADRARDVHMTGSQLTHAFRRFLGESPHQFVVRQRLIVATRLLMSGFNVSETCYRSGFENLSHFCRTFQRAFGVRASRWHTVSKHESRRKVQAIEHRLI